MGSRNKQQSNSHLAGGCREVSDTGGRSMLINSIFDALPTYVMSLLLVKVEKRLDELRRGFLWHGNRDKRTLH